jgi:hypothetical protein
MKASVLEGNVYDGAWSAVEFRRSKEALRIPASEGS